MHTTAYTPKQEPSLPRPQHSLELPAKSSPKEQPEEADARLWRVSASSGVAAPLGCVIFFCFCQNCGLYTLHSWPFRMCETRGGITTLGAFCTFTNIPGPGIRTANFAAFGSWPGVRQKDAESLGTAMRLCVSLSRGVAAPLGCVIFLLLSKLQFSRPALRAFRAYERGGGITTLGALCVLLKRRTVACQNDLFAVF